MVVIVERIIILCVHIDVASASSSEIKVSGVVAGAGAKRQLTHSTVYCEPTAGI